MFNNVCIFVYEEKVINDKKYLTLFGDTNRNLEKRKCFLETFYERHEIVFLLVAGGDNHYLINCLF